jgi:hypothetical protein
VENTPRYETGCKFLGEFVEDAANANPGRKAPPGQGVVEPTRVVGVFVDDAASHSPLKDFVIVRRDHSTVTVTGCDVRPLQNGRAGSGREFAVVLREGGRETIAAQFPEADLLAILADGVNLLTPAPPKATPD